VANSIVPQDARLLTEDRFAAYLNCSTTSADCLDKAGHWLAPAELAREMQSHGITHVLLAQPDTDEPLAAGQRCFGAEAWAPRDAVTEEAAALTPFLPLAEFRVARGDAAVVRYSLLRIR
jgi:hypothetical protein